MQPRVKQAVLVDDWFATVDLKDAYFQIGPQEIS